MAEPGSGIQIDIDPVLIRIGPASLRWYALMLALGIAAGLWLTLRESRRKGLDDEAVCWIAVWSLLVGIVVARAISVLDKLDFYLQSPVSILSPSQGGLAMWGALLGGCATAALLSRRWRAPAARLLDATVPGILLGQIVGRLGSIVNGDSWGSPTDLPWGLVYTRAESLVPPASLGIPTHPYPIYELIWSLAILVGLWTLRRRLRGDGMLLVFFVLLFSIGKFGLSFYREEGVLAFGLQQSQVLAIIVFLVALPVLVYLLLGGDVSGATAHDDSRPGATPAG